MLVCWHMQEAPGRPFGLASRQVIKDTAKQFKSGIDYWYYRLRPAIAGMTDARTVLDQAGLTLLEQDVLMNEVLRHHYKKQERK